MIYRIDSADTWCMWRGLTTVATRTGHADHAGEAAIISASVDAFRQYHLRVPLPGYRGDHHGRYGAAR